MPFFGYYLVFTCTDLSTEVCTFPICKYDRLGVLNVEVLACMQLGVAYTRVTFTGANLETVDCKIT